MKNKLILRLCLMTIALLSSNACRQDILHEQETYNNTSAFQLTSKRISLTEAKHKAKLLPEIEKAETEFKKLKTNAFGKTVNYGNGVSIDTESVIFIENGPNYHTYTFNVISENTSADAPLENLLLTPLPDGTYKKLLISYNFTEQEKQIINSGGYVNTKGKSKVTDLGKGTLDNIVSKSQSCGYVEAQAYTICSEGVHFHGESNCNADVKSQLITVYLWKCESIDDGSGTSGGGPSSGSGPGEGGGGSPCPDCPTDGGTTPTEPCNGNGVLTGPLDPTTDIGDGSTCTGVPTLPNSGLPIRNNPCQKTKAMLQSPNVQQGIADVKEQAKKAANDINEGEIGRIEKNDGTIAPADVSEDHHVTFNDITGSKGIYHSHTYNGAKIHSPPDIYSILDFASVQPSVANYGDAYVGMIGANRCYPATPTCFRMRNYVIRFSGTTADLGISFTDAEMKQFNKDYKDRESELSEKLPYVDFLGDELNHKGVEKLFFDTLANMGLSGKVILQRVDDDGTVNNINLDANGVPVATPCPTT